MSLVKYMSRYTTDYLVLGSAEEFERDIRGLVGVEDAEVEGYDDTLAQRDQSVKFYWGHNHDFGTFKMAGMMGDRHLTIVGDFVDRGAEFKGKKVLDVGCWTGGTSLLLAGMGATVIAIEEVRKYADCIRFLVDSFGAGGRIGVQHCSLYDAGSGYAVTHDGTYDCVLLSGVLYHVSDPVLALRICYNRLGSGGQLLVESAGMVGDESVCRYSGPTQAFGGTIEDRSRAGWNWFTPTAKVLKQMLHDVGFAEVGIEWHRHRLYAIATKHGHVDMLRAGLSNRKVG